MPVPIIPVFDAAGTMVSGVGQATEGTWNAFADNDAVYNGLGQAGTCTWNALANNKDLHKGAEFGAKAAGVVTIEVSITVAIDVGLAYVPNKWIRGLQSIPAGNLAVVPKNWTMC